MTRLLNLESKPKKTPSKRKANSPTHLPTQAEIDAAMKKNWGNQAYKTFQHFRRIWEKDGAKLVP